MKTREKSFFDEDARLSELSKKGDSLEKLNSNINCEIFREPVERALCEKEPKGPGGRPSIDEQILTAQAKAVQETCCRGTTASAHGVGRTA